MIGSSPFQPGLVVTKKLYNRTIFFITFVFAVLAFTGSSKGVELIYGKGLLWQVSLEGSEPSYIYGTLYSSERRVVDSGILARNLLRKSDYLLVDIVDDDSIQQKLFAAMVFRDNRRLDELVSPDTFEKIKVLGYEYGFLALQMKVLKPWAAGVMFSFPPSEASRISLGIRTLNQTLQDLALVKGIEIIPLETIEEQLQSLDAGSEQEQIILLDALPANINVLEAKFQTSVSNYLEQNSQGLYEQFLRSISVLPTDNAKRYEQNYLIRRNYQMAKRLQDALVRGNGFVAIDALHLPGEEGILKLLEAQGYQIKAVE